MTQSVCVCSMRLKTGWCNKLVFGVREIGGIIELWERWVGWKRGLTGRQKGGGGGSRRWSCSQSGRDLRARGGHPSSAPVPTPTLASQALIFHMISFTPVLRLALGLRAAGIAAPFSDSENFTETCFIITDPTGTKSQKLRMNYYYYYIWVLVLL